MAIDLTTTYPGQVDTTDVAFPYGKPQNEAVEGDNTGTPLEALWLQDVYGFLQALLVAGGVTPSGVPDEANASDYLDALQAGDHTWTGDNNFSQVVGAPGYTASGTGQYNYAAPRTRTFMLALDRSSAIGTLPDNNEGWSYTGGRSVVNAAGVYHTRRWSFRLVDGATLKRVRLGYLSTVAHTIDVVVRRTTATKVSPFAPVETDLATISLSATTQELDSGALATVANGALDMFAVDILASATGQAICYIEIEVLEPGLRNG